MTIIKNDERAMFALGFDAVGVEAMRHFLRMVGTLKDSQTLPETVMRATMADSNSLGAEVAELRKAFESSLVHVQNAAHIGELQKQIDGLSAQVRALSHSNAELAELRKYVESQAIRAIFPAQPTDWEHPGKLGDKTPNTVKVAVGTVAVPSLTLGDVGTGWFRSALDEWAMAIAGVLLATFSATKALFKQNVETEKQFVSTVATGTPPLAVSSTTLVPNLHVAVADSLGTAGAYPADATDLPTAITLVNYIKSRNISKGV